MKKLLIIAISAATTLPIFANNSSLQHKIEQEKRKNKIEKVATELKLTTEQKESMKSIQQEFTAQMKELKSQNLSKEEMREKRKQLNKERKQKIQLLLTPEQRDTAERIRAERQEKAETHRKGKGYSKHLRRSDMSAAERAERMTERMAQALNLSEEQQAKAIEINLKYAKESESIGEGKEKKEQIMELRKRQKAELAGILNDEQVAKIEELEAKQMAKRKRGRRAHR